jgi:hypothetical protein
MVIFEQMSKSKRKSGKTKQKIGAIQTKNNNQIQTYIKTA